MGRFIARRGRSCWRNVERSAVARSAGPRRRRGTGCRRGGWIHAVGPVWTGGLEGEAALLAGCYQNSLAVAAAYGVTTIAFPSISTGVYGYPIERAAAIAVRVVREEGPLCPLLRQVIFCCFSEGDLAVYRGVLGG